MKINKFFSLISILLLVCCLRNFNNISLYTNTFTEEKVTEKRGNPSYDFIIGKDLLPHFRVFFWVDKNATNYIPYADEGINTNVSSHGPAEGWTVIETKTTKENEKLVYIFVPKTFVLLHGRDFDKLIHIEAITDN